MTEITDAMVEAGVLAYDAARCASHGPGERPMSKRNRETIAPMIRAALTAALSSAPEGEPVAWDFAVGQRVEKFTGEARWHGVVVSRYLTTKGSARYVVEVEPQGFQMLAVPSQLRDAPEAGPGILDVAEVMAAGARCEQPYRYQTPDHRSFSQSGVPPIYGDYDPVTVAPDTSREAIRREAFEEAAEVAEGMQAICSGGDDFDAGWGSSCVAAAKAIRARGA